jgi:hypothetical protein
LFTDAPNKLCKFGVLRMVRDAFHIPGRLQLDAQGRLLQIVLCDRHPLARSFALGLERVLKVKIKSQSLNDGPDDAA